MTKIKKIIYTSYAYVYSLSMVLPVFATPVILPTAATFTNVTISMSSTTESNPETLKEVLEKEEVIPDTRAVKIDAYFARHNLPLTGYGKAFVETADKYNLDYTLLPAIAMRESTGGKFGCPGGNKNVFGWASCKVKFSTYEEAIDKVGQHLSGNVKSTSGYYGNKTTYQKLRKYNSVIDAYPREVAGMMTKIDNMKIYSDLSYDLKK